MTIPGIWTEGGGGWELSRPEGFPDEETLRGLIEATPDMLPLAGAPALVILGREVGLGPGSADLVGVEASGRPVIIELKLRKNAEARRAVVAQILSYAAYLHGMTRAQLEDRLSEGLQNAGHQTILGAVMASDQEGAFEREGFEAELDGHLSEGRFRLVFVLDDVPQELMALVAYLEHVTDDKLAIDLVAVGAFDVNDTSVMIPQRVTPERHEAVAEQTRAERRRRAADTYPGADKFEALFDDAPEENRETINAVLDWARGLEERGHARLKTTIGSISNTLRPILRGDRSGIVVIWGGTSQFDLVCHESVLKRRAPSLVKKVSALSPESNWKIPFAQINSEVLNVLSEAYEQAAK